MCAFSARYTAYLVAVLAAVALYAADATGQWSLEASSQHLDNVLRVCEMGRRQGKGQCVGVLYDALARAKWAEAAASNDPSFDLAAASKVIDQDVLAAAEEELRLTGEPRLTWAGACAVSFCD